MPQIELIQTSITKTYQPSNREEKKSTPENLTSQEDNEGSFLILDAPGMPSLHVPPLSSKPEGETLILCMEVIHNDGESISIDRLTY